MDQHHDHCSIPSTPSLLLLPHDIEEFESSIYQYFVWRQKTQQLRLQQQQQHQHVDEEEEKRRKGSREGKLENKRKAINESVDDHQEVGHISNNDISRDLVRYSTIVKFLRQELLSPSCSSSHSHHCEPEKMLKDLPELCVRWIQYPLLLKQVDDVNDIMSKLQEQLNATDFADSTKEDITNDTKKGTINKKGKSVSATKNAIINKKGKNQRRISPRKSGKDDDDHDDHDDDEYRQEENNDNDYCSPKTTSKHSINDDANLPMNLILKESTPQDHPDSSAVRKKRKSQREQQRPSPSLDSSDHENDERVTKKICLNNDAANSLEEHDVAIIATTKNNKKKKKKNETKKESDHVKRKKLKWEERYEQLLQFYNERGHCRIPANHDLYKWVKDQRSYHRLRSHKLTMERFAKLEAIRFNWNPSCGNKMTFIQFFQNCKEYVTQYGHCNIPNQFNELNENGIIPTEDDKKLRMWARMLRKSYHTKHIDKQRLDMLNSIGFVWDVQKQSSPTTNANSSSNNNNDDNSGDDVVTMNQNSDYIHDRFLDRIEQLRKVKEVCGRCSDKKDILSVYPNNPEIYMWVRVQRKDYRKWKNGLKSPLNEERRILLQSLDFDFQPRKHYATPNPTSERNLKRRSIEQQH